MQKATYGFFGLILFVCVASLPSVRISDDISKAMLANDLASYKTYQEFLNHFPNDLYATFALVQESCTEGAWEFLLEFERELQSIPTVHRTISLGSEATLYVTEEADELLSDPFRDTRFESAEHRCEIASSYPPTSGSLISESGKIFTLVVIAKSAITTAEFNQDLRKVFSTWHSNAAAEGIRLLVTGDPIISAGISSAIEQDSSLIAVVILVLVLLVYIATRSAKTAIATLTLIVFSISGALAFTVWIEMAITPGSALAVFLLAPLSAAFVIHSSEYVFREAEDSAIPKEAILPTVLAGITTAIFFGSTGLTVSPDVQSLALIGVVGIFFSVVGLFLFVFPFLKDADLTKQSQVVVKTWVVTRASLSYSLLAALLIFVLLGLSSLRFEYESIDYLPLDNPDRAALEELGPVFGYLTIPLYVNVEDISDIKVWSDLSNLVARLESTEHNVKVDWLYESLSEFHESINGSSDTPFPQSSAELEQLLLLVNTADFDRLISPSQSELALMLNVPFKGSGDYYKLKNFVDGFLAEHEIKGRLTGRVSGYFETGHQVGIENLTGLAWASLFLFIALIFLFKSISMATIVIVINLIPTLTAISALSIANIPIDLGSSIVTAIAFGIIVDDSTHLVLRVKTLRSSGFDPYTAVVFAIRDLARPIVFTSIVLSLGFAILLFAEIRTFHDFSMTILIALGVALLADMMILPTLVRQFVRDPLVPRS